MNARIKWSLVACMLAFTVLMNGCGYSSYPQGKVVKGPVSGATVRDSTGAVVGTTDANGNFPLSGKGPYTTTGGTFIQLKADGTPGTAIAAPPMSCPEGFSQITPLSTLVQSATEARDAGIPGAQTELTNLLAIIDANGGLNADLSVKTAANEELLILSEAAGAILTNTPSGSLPTAIEALITAVASIPPATPLTTTAVLAPITTQITLELPALAVALNAAATTAANGADNALLEPLPVITGATGGSGSGGL